MRNLINTISAKLPVIYGSIEEQRDAMAVLEALDRNINLHELETAVLGELFPMSKKVVSRAIRAAIPDIPEPAKMASADSLV